MKPGWEIKKLGEVCQIANGGTPKTGVAEYWNGHHLWVTPAEMGNRDNPFINNTERKISDLGLKNSSAQLLPPYSVILSSRAPIGHLVINTKQMATNQGCKGLIPSNNLNHKFLYFFLGKNIDLLNSLGTGATFKELSASKLKDVTIPLPPLSEQKRIVALLDEAFEAISRAKANAEKNLKNSKELFESYLNNIFSNPGKDWEEKSIQGICKVINGYAFSSKDFKPTNSIKSIKITNVGVKEFVEEDGNYLPDTYRDTLKEVQVKEGNIVLALTRTIISAGLKVAVVPKSYDGALVNQRVAALIPNTNIVNQRFLYNYLTTNCVAKYVLAHVNTLMQPNLSIGNLKSMPVPCPNLAEQQSIVAKLDAISAETKKLESIYQKKLEDLEELKKSILNKAFAGEL